VFLFLFLGVSFYFVIIVSNAARASINSSLERVFGVIIFRILPACKQAGWEIVANYDDLLIFFRSGSMLITDSFYIYLPIVPRERHLRHKIS